jgi:hypothetical protein
MRYIAFALVLFYATSAWATEAYIQYREGGTSVYIVDGEEVDETTYNDALVQIAEDRKDIDNISKLDKAIALVLLDGINTLRVREGLSEVTPAQLKQAVKDKYNAL